MRPSLTEYRDLDRMKSSIQHRQCTRSYSKADAVKCRSAVQRTTKHVTIPHRKGSNTALLKWLMLVKTLIASKFCPDFKGLEIHTHTQHLHISQEDPPLPMVFLTPGQQQQSTAAISATITMCLSGKPGVTHYFLTERA